MKHIKALFIALSLSITSFAGFAVEKLPMVMVYRTASCEYCSDWETHLKDNGFQVMPHIVDDVAPHKKRANLPEKLTSCHTAFVGDYVVEGHVPAEDIKRMLKQKPDIQGIVVPGMPIGSPGMEQGDQKEVYQTFSYTKDGSISVYASH